MNNLPKYGIIPQTDHGNDTEKSLTELLHSEKNHLEPGQFFAESNKLLEKLEKVVLSEIVPELETYYGRWHPSGFMVYQLGNHKDLGTLRLHIWPRGLRKRQTKGMGKLNDIYDGDIHNHAWNLTSRVLSFYCDNIYDVKPIEDGDFSDEELSSKNIFRVFNVSYGENVKQSLMPNGKFVTAVVAYARKANKGEVHTIEPGVFHSPTIPENEIGATLVLDSYRITDGPDVLIRGTIEPVYDTRQTISKEEAIIAKTQLLDAINDKA